MVCGLISFNVVQGSAYLVACPVLGTPKLLYINHWELLWVHAYGVVRQHSVLRRVLRRFWEGFWERGSQKGFEKGGGLLWVLQ